jgi:hypothetical protein
MGKSTPQPPPAPDPVAVANAQTGTNVDTAVAQSQLNNVNRVGPGGSTTFTAGAQGSGQGYTDPKTGMWVPQYTETTSLSPLGNELLGGQSNLASEYLPMLANAGANVQPLNINGGANAEIVNQGPQALDTNVANAVYGEQAGFLGPQWQQQQKDLQDQLSRQGIPVGSDAYSNAMTQFNNSQTQAYQAASNNAIGQGAQIAGQNFGLALQGQNQGVNLQQQAQTNPLTLLSLLTAGAGIGGGA